MFHHLFSLACLWHKQPVFLFGQMMPPQSDLNWAALQENCLVVIWLNNFQESLHPFSTTALHENK
jgi:hypothetical protein